MEISIKSATARRFWTLLELAVFLVLSLQVLRTLAADRLATSASPTIPDLQRAIRLDPSDAKYHEDLGNLFRFYIGNIDLPRAMENLKLAVELDPYSPQPWLDLGAALEFQGRIAEAEACLERANALAPNLTTYQWAIGNFYLLHGNLPLAFRSFKKVLAGTSEYDGVVFDIAWKASGDGPQILRDLIPNRMGTEYSYLNYLLHYQRYLEAGDVWKRMAAGAEAFPPDWAAQYIDKLIEIHQPDQADQVWTDLRNKGLIRPTYEPTSQNLVVNGNFEDDLLNIGFDWRAPRTPSAYVGLDPTNFHSPSQSLLIQFMGTSNVNFNNFYQYVRLQPGRDYQFRAYVRTAGITTDSGPRFEIRDAYDPARLDHFSESFVGDSGGWIPVEFKFAAGPETNLVILGVVRPPSNKLDNQIAGRFWVDNVLITPAEGAATGLNSGEKHQ